MFQVVARCTQLIEKVLPPIVSSAIASQPTTSPANTPLDCHQSSCPKQAELNILKNERGYWKKMHQLATEREEKLNEEIEHLQGRIRYLEQQLYGHKSEKKSGGSEKQAPPKDQKKRPRGQQKGAKGHGRRNHDHLPKEEVFVELPEEEQICPCCGLPFKELALTEDSEEKVIEVRAHRRVYKRKRYTPTCECPANPAIVTAPVPAKLFPKGGCGISIWVEIILWKFVFQVPTNRILNYWEQSCELALPPGTVNDNLKRLPPLFAPLENAIFQRCRDAYHWHADETRWFVFSDEVTGKNWYLWVFRSVDTVVYILDPTRSSIVPQSFFGSEASGVISADRYSGYKTLLKDGRFLIAYCWDHVRRDFLDFSNKYPQMEAWGLEWKTDIGALYHLNNQRLALPPGSDEYVETNSALKKAVDEMEQKCAEELSSEKLHPAKRKILESLEKHWSGLVLFVKHPWIPISNAEAERKLRNPVNGRKDYHGSGSIWSGFLMATLLTILQTVMNWGLNPRSWLILYLEACAKAGGIAPPDAESFLPWNLSEEMLESLSSPTKDRKTGKGREPPCNLQPSNATVEEILRQGNSISSGA
jgi:transposase